MPYLPQVGVEEHSGEIRTCLGQGPIRGQKSVSSTRGRFQVSGVVLGRDGHLTQVRVCSSGFVRRDPRSSWLCTVRYWAFKQVWQNPGFCGLSLGFCPPPSRSACAPVGRGDMPLGVRGRPPGTQHPLFGAGKPPGRLYADDTFFVTKGPR